MFLFSSLYSPFCCKCSLTSPSPYSSSKHSFRFSAPFNIPKHRKFKVYSKLSRAKNFPRAGMNNSSVSLPPLPEQRIVVGCGTVTTDYLASVAAFPQPDEKIRSTALQVANDAPGRGILAELKADGVDTSYIVVSETGNSPFTYVIVDTQMKTRTCIHSPGTPPMIPEDLPASTLSSALIGATIVYFDGRLPEIAHIVAKEATRRELPILVDAERKREGLDELLTMTDYVVCSAKFPQVGSLEADGIGKIYGRLLVGTSEAIPPSELVDTTGAGDGFIGAILYALIARMPPEKMLPFAAKVAAAGCRALGARTGLPYRSDSQLGTYL